MENPSLLLNSNDLLRLVRLERNHQFKESTKETLRNEILSSFAREDTQLVSSHDANLEFRIRQLIQSNANWLEIRVLLSQHFMSEKSLKSATRLIETAYVVADSNAVMTCFEEVFAILEDQNFYWELHPSLRDFIIDHSPKELLCAINNILVKEDNESRYSPVEALLVFLNLLESKNKNYAWVFWGRNESKLNSACLRQEHLNLTHDALLLKLTQLAIHLHSSTDAKNFANQISIASPEREQAIHLLLEFQSKPVRKNDKEFFEKIKTSESWNDTISFLERSFLDFRKSNLSNEDIRHSLNELMVHPQKWLNFSLEAWHSFSLTLVNNRDLYSHIPNLFNFYLDNVQLYDSATYCKAVWQPWLDCKPESNYDHLFRAISSVSIYCFAHPHEEQLLWDGIEEAKKITQPALSQIFQNSVRVTLSHIERSKNLTNTTRNQITATLNLALAGKDGMETALEPYLESCTNPNISILNSYLNQCWEKKNINLYFKTSYKLHKAQPYENKSLLRNLSFAIKKNNTDLVWRAATILEAREALPTQLKSAWKISGESRTTYLPDKITTQSHNVAIFNFNPASQRVFRALSTLSVKLIKLIEIAESQSRRKQRPLKPSNTVEENICSALKRSGFDTDLKSFASNIDNEAISEDIHLFNSISLNDPWVFTVKKIMESLSAPSWGYDKDQLYERVSNVLPHLGTTFNPSTPAKVGRWLTSLDTHERAAWSELTQSLELLSSKNFSSNLLKYSLRLATMIYPSHYNALKILQNSRISLDIIRDFECFVLSEEYSKFRHQHGKELKVIFPVSLIDYI